VKLKEGFVLKTVGDNHIVVPVGAQTVDFRSMITLNETGMFLWKQLQADVTAEELEAALLAEYDVTAEIANRDIAAFVAKLQENSLLED
jgi:hypothetical protein